MQLTPRRPRLRSSSYTRPLLDILHHRHPRHCQSCTIRSRRHMPGSLATKIFKHTWMASRGRWRKPGMRLTYNSVVSNRTSRRINRGRQHPGPKTENGTGRGIENGGQARKIKAASDIPELTSFWNTMVMDGLLVCVASYRVAMIAMRTAGGQKIFGGFTIFVSRCNGR